MMPGALTGKFALAPLRMSENHKLYAEHLKNPAVRIVLATGPPGTGKSISAMSAGISALRRGDVRRLLITRPMVSVDEHIESAPGDAHAQLSPYLSHCTAMLESVYDAAVLDRLIGDGSIRFVPLGLLRGATFMHEFVIADELQNATVLQMRMLLTRIGEGSKLVGTGDMAQNDRTDQESGLADFVARLRRAGAVHSIKHVELTGSDSVRDPVVDEVLKIYGL
jgi:phosphate starvation-inducible PhoH-like protein